MKIHCKICTLKSQAAAKLSDEELDKLSLNCANVKFHKGDALIKQGTFSTNVAYLKTGLVKVHIAGPYHEQIVRIVKAPGYLGLPTTFGDKINQYSVTALEACDVCFIDLETFRFLLKENPDFSYEIMIELCKNELEVFYRCASRTQKQIRGKIADVLIELSEHIFNSEKFVIPITQEEFGNLVDASRESISRIMTEFEKDGIVKTSAKKIEILKRDTLIMVSENG